MVNILVTGGAGYIGSHACKALKKQGHNPVTFDNLSRGFKKSVQWGPLVEGNLQDFDKLKKTMEDHKIEAVLHFAAYAYVGESIAFPEMYFDNNVKGSVLLFEAMKEAGVKTLVFSSTCATYGEAQSEVINESHPQNPINPYGLSKLMIEKMLVKYGEKYDFNFCGLRYFNASGADPDLEIGECHDPEPHIIPNIIRAGLNGEAMKIFGNDYPTPDGTCIRDFIHVTDLAQAHVLVLENLLNQKTTQSFYNLGNTQGYSLLELIKKTEEILEKSIPFEVTQRRQGDPAKLIGASDLFLKDFKWERKHSDLETILKTSIAWTKNQKN